MINQTYTTLLIHYFIILNHLDGYVVSKRALTSQTFGLSLKFSIFQKLERRNFCTFPKFSEPKTYEKMNKFPIRAKTFLYLMKFFLFIEKLFFLFVFFIPNQSVNGNRSFALSTFYCFVQLSSLKYLFRKYARINM
jgi:hypothetical protein